MMKKIFTGLSLFAFMAVFSQTGMGTETPEGALDINSPNKNWGLVLPQVDRAENTKNPTGKAIKKGTIVYDLKENCIKYFNGSDWSGCLVAAPTPIKLVCSSAVLNQDIIANYPISGDVTTVSIPYSNPGEAFNIGEITVSSTDVTGLNAVLPSGTIQKGSGNLVFLISGTPSTTGNAKFPLNIGGANCEFIIPVKNYTDVKALAITNLICDQKNQLGYTTLKGKQIVNGKEVTVNYRGSGIYNSPYSDTYCNGTTINNSIHIGPNEPGTLIITFSRPVTNVAMAFTGINDHEEFTFSTNRNEPIQLQLNSSCPADIKITGNKMSVPRTKQIALGGTLTIGGVWFTELTIRHNGATSGSSIGFCLNSAL